MRSTIDELLGRRWVADQHLDHEAVDLRLGQRVRALGLDRVLGREHEERARGPVKVSRPIVTWRSCITSSSALCTLAGARLISSASSRLVKTGPSDVVNSPVFWLKMRVPTRSAGTRSGVNWMRLNSPPIDVGERLDGHRLGEAGHAFDEQVAARQQRDDQPLEQVVLADDDLLDLVEHALHRRGAVAVLVRGVVVHSRLGPLALSTAAGRRRRRDVDGDGEADADEDVVLGGVEERGRRCRRPGRRGRAAGRPSCRG